MAKREVYLSNVKMRLSQWGAQLEELRAKRTDVVGSPHHAQLDTWKAGLRAIADKVKELRKLDEKWYVIKDEVEKGMRTIEAALGGAVPAQAELPQAEPPKTEPPKTELPDA